MKKVFLTIGIALAVIISGCSQSITEDKSAEGPKIEFKSTTHDFGTIKEGSDGMCNFEFKNTGKQPLILKNVQATCGCTTPNWPREPINPGKKGSIAVKYNTKRIGAFTKSIKVYSNATENYITLIIKGKVVVPEEKKSTQ